MTSIGNPLLKRAGQVIYVAKYGNDNNSGLNSNEPKLTLAGAKTWINTLTLTSNSRVTLVILDAGRYTENITLIQYMSIFGPYAHLTGAINLAADSVVSLFKAERSGGGTVSMAAASGRAFVYIDEISNSGGATAISNTGAASSLYARVGRVSTDTGIAILCDTTSGTMHVDIRHVDVIGNGGTAVKCSNGRLLGEIDHLVESGSPTGTIGLDIDGGICDLSINMLHTDTAIDVESGAVLNLFVSNITGTELNDGEANILTPKNASKFKTLIDENWSSGDFTAGGWTVANGTEVNKWEIGTDEKESGANGCYVSDDGGTTNNYATGSASISHFYKDVVIPAGAYDIVLAFSYKGQGESIFDYMAVSILDTTDTVTAGASVEGVSDDIGTFNLQAAFTRFATFLSNNYAGSTKRLVFSWDNDGSLGTNPPIAIDNIKLTYKQG